MKSILVIAAVFLTLPAAAQAKGPASAAITGPGLSRTALPDSFRILELTGIDPHSLDMVGLTLPGRPTGDLGPRYTIIYDFGSATLRQDLYPYAEDGPIVYTRPNSTLVVGGGWLPASTDLMQALVGLGLSKAAPAGTSRKGSLAGIAAGAFAAGMAGLVLVRRRRRS